MAVKKLAPNHNGIFFSNSIASSIVKPQPIKNPIATPRQINSSFGSTSSALSQIPFQRIKHKLNKIRLFSLIKDWTTSCSSDSDNGSFLGTRFTSYKGKGEPRIAEPS